MELGSSFLFLQEQIKDIIIIELVDVLHNGLTLILYKVLDIRISADGNPKANVAVNHTITTCW